MAKKRTEILVDLEKCGKAQNQVVIPFEALSNENRGGPVGQLSRLRKRSVNNDLSAIINLDSMTSRLKLASQIINLHPENHNLIAKRAHLPVPIALSITHISHASMVEIATQNPELSPFARLVPSPSRDAEGARFRMGLGWFYEMR